MRSAWAKAPGGTGRGLKHGAVTAVGTEKEAARAERPPESLPTGQSLPSEQQDVEKGSQVDG